MLWGSPDHPVGSKLKHIVMFGKKKLRNYQMPITGTKRDLETQDLAEINNRLGRALQDHIHRQQRQLSHLVGWIDFLSPLSHLVGQYGFISHEAGGSGISTGSALYSGDRVWLRIAEESVCGKIGEAVIE